MVSFKRREEGRGRREEGRGRRGKREGEKLWQMMSTVWCMLQSEVSSDYTVVLLMLQPLLVLKQRRLEASN